MTDRRVYISKSGMTGTGTDTRMYSPRSESSHMYRNNHEEDTYGMEDGKVRDDKYERKLQEKEKTKEKRNKIKHIRIKPSDLPEEEDEERDDSEKIDADRELSAQTGPPGNLGFETSLAMGAKGPGAAAGNLFAMGESMDIIQLLKMGKYGKRGVGADRSFLPTTRQKDVAVTKRKTPKELLMQPHTGTLRLERNLTEAQKRDLVAVRQALGEYGNSLNIPKNVMTRDLSNFMPISQTTKDKRGEKGDRRYTSVVPGQKGVNISTGQPRFRNLTSRQKDITGLEGMDLAQALDHENYMDALSNMSRYTQAQNLPDGEPKPEPKPVEQAPSIKPNLSSEYQKLMNSILGDDGNISTGELMFGAWSTLMKENRPLALLSNQELNMKIQMFNANYPLPPSENNAEELDVLIDEFENRQEENPTNVDPFGDTYQEEYEPNNTDGSWQQTVSPTSKIEQPSYHDPYWQDVMTGEPMGDAWSTLMKATEKEMDKRRAKERNKKWRPSTGQFDTPPGGSLGPKGSTGRRDKALRSSIKQGKKTGLELAHVAVERSHRGRKVKQPLSKDPQKYREYQGTMEARKRVGNVRVPTASQRRFGQRKYFAGPTGGGRLPAGVGVKKPRIHSPRMSSAPSVPHLNRRSTPSAGLSVGKMGLRRMGAPPVAVSAPPVPPPQPPIQDPSQIQMSSDLVAVSSLLKAGPTHADIVELRSLVRQMKRALKTKDTTSKGMGTKDTSGAGEDKPKYNSASFRTTSRPEGATEDATNDSQAFGVHPENRGGPTP